MRCGAVLQVSAILEVQLEVSRGDRSPALRRAAPEQAGAAAVPRGVPVPLPGRGLRME